MVPIFVLLMVFSLHNQLSAAQPEFAEIQLDTPARVRPMDGPPTDHTLYITDSKNITDQPPKDNDCCIYRRALKSVKEKGVLRVKKSDLFTDQPQAQDAQGRGVPIPGAQEIFCCCFECSVFSCKEDPCCVINCCCLVISLLQACSR